MKQSCDQHCETCPMQTQVHCAVVHARAAYITATSIFQRLDGIEQALRQNDHPLINPLAMGIGSALIDIEEEDSEILPAPEVGV
jgi:hypothetical protein